MAPLWRRHAILALLAASSEAAIGFWLRKIPSLSAATSNGIGIWIAVLGALLVARVACSWRRDLVRESAALGSGTDFHRALWIASEAPPARADNSWLAREGREWIESGTRAAAEMRTAIVTLAVLLPALVWLAP